MAVLLWHTVKSDATVRYCTEAYTRQARFTRYQKIRPCITGHPVLYINVPWAICNAEDVKIVATQAKLFSIFCCVLVHQYCVLSSSYSGTDLRLRGGGQRYAAPLYVSLGWAPRSWLLILLFLLKTNKFRMYKKKYSDSAKS